MINDKYQPTNQPTDDDDDDNVFFSITIELKKIEKIMNEFEMFVCLQQP